MPLRRLLSYLALALTLSACGSKPIPFTEYLVENMLRENLATLAQPPIFEVKDLRLSGLNSAGDNGSADANISLLFTEDFATVVDQRQLDSDSLLYRQIRGSFGEFAAGELQVHHARYQFQRVGGKWRIVGSQPTDAPTISEPVAESE